MLAIFASHVVGDALKRYSFPFSLEEDGQLSFKRGPFPSVKNELISKTWLVKWYSSPFSYPTIIAAEWCKWSPPKTINGTTHPITSSHPPLPPTKGMLSHMWRREKGEEANVRIGNPCQVKPKRFDRATALWHSHPVRKFHMSIPYLTFFMFFGKRFTLVYLKPHGKIISELSLLCEHRIAP